MKLLFVYGSLLSDMHNHSILSSSDLLGVCKTEPIFDMVDLGAFPALLMNGQTAIQGEVYSVSEAVYEMVERLEGYPSFYDRTSLRTPHGEAEVYYLPRRDSRREYSLVESGDWKGFYRTPLHT